MAEILRRAAGLASPAHRAVPARRMLQAGAVRGSGVDNVGAYAIEGENRAGRCTLPFKCEYMACDFVWIIANEIQ